MAPDGLDDSMAHVRKRPGMYIGSTGSGGMFHLVLEVIANAFDEVLAGRAQSIGVTVHGDGSVEIIDDGPGMGAGRLDQEAFITAMCTSVRFEPTADGHHPHVHLSQLGRGLGVVSALSERLDVEVRMPSTTLRQSFRRGVAEGPAARTPGPSPQRGSTVRLWPDPQIFEAPAALPIGKLYDRLTELSRLEPRVRFTFNVEPIELDPAPDLATMWRVQYHIRATAPGPVVVRGHEGVDEVEIATDFGGWRAPQVKGYCNFLEVSEGNAVVEGVADGVRRLFGPGEAERLIPHVRALVHLRLLDPEWGGPTKARIDDPRAGALIASTIADQLPAALDLRPDLRAQIEQRGERPDNDS